MPRVSQLSRRGAFLHLAVDLQELATLLSRELVTEPRATMLETSALSGTIPRKRKNWRKE
jgi:hypothetical protein